MPSTQSESHAAIASPTPSAPVGLPDWVHFEGDLSCPRCAYNLRSLTGSRCPECGLDLDWPAIVEAAARLTNLQLFEYKWQNRPIRSFFYTVLLSLQPWRTWKVIPLTAKPCVRGLTWLTALVIVAHSVALVGMTLTMHVLYASLTHSGWHPTSQFSIASHAILWCGVRGLLYGLCAFASAFVLWFFQGPAGRQHICLSHIFRIGVMTFVLLASAEVTMNFMAHAYMFIHFVSSHAIGSMFKFSLVAEILIIAFIIWFLYRAGRDYLQSRRPRAVALTSVLTTAIIWMIVYNLSSSVLGSWGMVTIRLSDTWPGFWWLASEVVQPLLTR